MRRFNPEKELYKIQHGNRNKVILGVIALLIILGISSSYALYQVRYSKRIIYTKVAPFSNKDITLTVLIDGERSNGFPNSEDGYYFNGLDCETKGVTTATWNYKMWTLNLTSSKPNKCSVLFSKEPSLLTERLKFLNDHKENLEALYDGDPGQNIRYTGKEPNNYIWFNCADYSNLTQETAEQQCEKWRIIGLMNNVETENNGEQDLVKIIRDEPLPNYYVWDDKPSGIGTSESEYGSNNWSDSKLMMLLNEGYSSNSLNTSGATGSLYWNHQKGKCLGATSAIVVSSGTTIDCDFTTKGLKDGTTKNMIESVKWKLGGTPNWSNSTASQFYTAERESATYNNKHQTEWIGKIGLMYPSDYGYAADKSCWSTYLYNYSTGSCMNSDWLFNSDYQWTITPCSYNSFDLFFVSDSGYVYLDRIPRHTTGVRPTLYLKSSVEIKSGDGNPKGEGPYIISL